jgi:hypothetical protein
MNRDAEAATLAVEGAASRIHTIVTQVKSNRVVYFTDDPDYSPPMDGDWYYISSYEGALPEEMSLRNCWRWRFNGGVFADSQPEEPLPRERALLEHNRKGLRRILKEKINRARLELAPVCSMGIPVRSEKEREAAEFLGGGQQPDGYPFLEGVALARKISLTEAARLVTARSEQTRSALVQTECIRERLALAIDTATSEAELLAIREQLLLDVFPRPTAQPQVDLTMPVERDQVLADPRLRHERNRLRVQLGEKIDGVRASFGPQYAWDEIVFSRKAALAQKIVAAGGEPPQGEDFSLVENYARARARSLLDAAQELLEQVRDRERVLTQTEKTRDSLLAEIAGIRTLRDVETVSAKIAAIETPA